MNTATDHEDYLATLALYAFDLLEGTEALEMRQHLDSGCSICEAELIALRETAAAIPEADPVSPPDSVRERLLREISKPLQEPLPGIFVVKPDRIDWRQTRFPGVSVKRLYVNEATQYMTTLLKIEPGAQYPSHIHKDVEQCLVLEGTVRIGNIRIGQGDFEYALANTTHDPITTDDGCVLLIISHQHDEYV
ncbi:MAG TPA: cupin domain-containing protein [Bryobacteraceae bacterium]|jgi:quercetin dioxygenase-like cupin family protein|nr:cupin domain-containing protein [Bryobacteraceae bacterium]